MPPLGLIGPLSRDVVAGAPPRIGGGPWHGIVRLEVPQSAGLADTIRVVDLVAAIVPRYAGVAHCDPRAPQNLQPVGALEKRLRHELGDSRYIRRLIEDALFDELREVAHV